MWEIVSSSIHSHRARHSHFLTFSLYRCSPAVESHPCHVSVCLNYGYDVAVTDVAKMVKLVCRLFSLSYSCFTLKEVTDFSFIQLSYIKKSDRNIHISLQYVRHW